MKTRKEGLIKKLFLAIKAVLKDKANIALLLVLLLAATLRFYKLGEQSLWYDEIITVIRAKCGLKHIFSLPHPLVHFLVYLELFLGNSEFVIRFYSAVFGILSVFVLYFLGRDIFGKSTGILSSLFLSIITSHIIQSQEARFYTLITFFSLLSLYFLIRAIKERSFRFWFLFLVAIFFSFFTHPTALFFILAEFFFLFLYLGWYLIKERSLLWLFGFFGFDKDKLAKLRAFFINKKRIFSSILVILILGLVLVRFFPFDFKNLFHFFGSPFSARSRPYPDRFEPNLTFVRWLFRFYWAGYYYRGPNVVFYRLSVFFLIGLASLLRKNKAILMLIVCWFLVPFLSMAVFKPAHFFEPRHFIFYVPIWLMVIAQGMRVASDFLQSILSKAGFYRCPSYPQLLSLFLSFNLFLYLFALPVAPQLKYYYEVWWKEDWRSIAKFFEEHYGKGDLIFAEGSSGLICLPYYFSKSEAEANICEMPWVQNHLQGKPPGVEELLWFDKYKVIITKGRLLNRIKNYSGTLWYLTYYRRPPKDIENGIIEQEVIFRHGRFHLYKVKVEK